MPRAERSPYRPKGQDANSLHTFRCRISLALYDFFGEEGMISCNRAVSRHSRQALAHYAACMPSHQHEVLLLLFHNRPQLAAELLRDVLHVDPPRYAKARSALPS